MVFISKDESYAYHLPHRLMTPQSSSKEGTHLPRSSATVSLWDLVGDTPIKTSLKADIVDDSFYAVEMTSDVPSEIVRLRMPMRHLSQVVEWLHARVLAHRLSDTGWRKQNRRDYLASRRRHARKRALATSVKPKQPTPESRSAKARYMRTYRANIALLKRDMKGDKLTRDERHMVARHKARITSKDKLMRLAKWRADRAAARAMLKAGHIFTPKGS